MMRELLFLHECGRLSAISVEVRGGRSHVTAPSGTLALDGSSRA